MNIEFVSIVIWSIIFLLGTHYFIKGKLANRGTKEYALAGRNLNAFQVGMSIIATYIGGGTLIAFSGQITTFGYAFFGAVGGVVIAFIILFFVANRYRQDQNVLATTMTERLKMAYGAPIILPSIIIILITLFSFIAIQIYGGALLIGEILNINFVLAAAILTIVTAFYSTLGGSRADVYTDIFQGIMIIGAVLFGIFFIYSGWPHQELKHMFVDSPEILNYMGQGIFFLFAMIVLPIFAIHTDPSIQFRLYMAHDNLTAKKGIFFGAIIYFIFIVSLIYLVLGIVGTTGMSGDKVLITFASSLEGKVMSIMITLAIYSAVISTMDSQAIKTATILVHDVFRTFDQKILPDITTDIAGNETTQVDDTEEGKHIRKLLPQIFLVGFVFSLCMYIVKDAFLVLSLVWVISIASFGVLMMGMWFPYLKHTIAKYAKFVRIEMLFFTFVIIVLSIYMGIMKTDNATVYLLVGGTAIVLLKFFFYTILYHINKGQINARS